MRENFLYNKKSRSKGNLEENVSLGSYSYYY